MALMTFHIYGIYVQVLWEDVPGTGKYLNQKTDQEKFYSMIRGLQIFVNLYVN